LLLNRQNIVKIEKNTVKSVQKLFDLFFTFRFFIVLIILTKSNVEADQMVECDFLDRSDGSVCNVRNVDLSKSTFNEKFSFSGSPEQKKNTSWIWFQESGRVAHVPRNLAEEFKMLTQLWIVFSETPIVKNSMFGPEFSWIKKLTLTQNQIKLIEERAFEHLINLVVINLQDNEIQSLAAGLFEHNRKLELTVLPGNKIKIVDPQVFQNLNQLREVDLGQNDCVNKHFGCQFCDTKIDHTELNRELQNCYENHKNSLDLLDEGENFRFIRSHPDMTSQNYRRYRSIDVLYLGAEASKQLDIRCLNLKKKPKPH
jgi:Leucine-rich repeat (LRR) protein